MELDGNRPEGVILEEIVRILKLNRSKGPRKPPRVLLMGPPGCGKTDHAKKLAQKYKLQYVKVSELLKDYIRNEKNPSKASELKQKLDTCKPCKQFYIFSLIYLVPNDLVIDLVKNRLEKPDCKINGYILDGCPTTNEQIAALNDLGIVPSLVITLDQSDSSVYEKIEQRRFDPIELKHYNLLLDEIPNEAQSRLI
jgi:adenylate kinase